MKTKIVGILVMTLLIATTLPAVGTMDNNNVYSRTGEVKDQYQEWSDECIYIDDYEWQEFVPTMAQHTRVEVKIVHWFSGSPPLKLSIEKPLGNVLKYKELPASAIPENNCNWVSFDIPDVTLIPGQNYYIKLTAPLGSEYGWGIAYNGLYPPGTSSKAPADWCFRTFCEEGGEPSMEVEKKVSKDDGATWEKEVDARICTNVRFRITVHNNGDYDLTNIVIVDTLPYCLEYADNAIPFEPQIQGNKLTWYFSGPLKYCETITIEFDAHVIEDGENINRVTVDAQSDGGPVDGSDSAIVNGLEDLVPKIGCGGEISWTRVKPGSTQSGTITVSNIGDPGSQLKWSVCGYPTWGTWSASPPSGTGLTPAMGPLSITVTVVAPSQQNQQYSGQIKLCNDEDPSDTCIIPVSLATPKNRPYINTPLLQFMQQHQLIYQLLQRLLNL